MWGLIYGDRGRGGGHHIFNTGTKFCLEAKLFLLCQRINHIGSKLPKVLHNRYVVCCHSIVTFSILPISLQNTEITSATKKTPLVLSKQVTFSSSLLAGQVES